MTSDNQDTAETLDDDMIGTGDAVTSDEIEVDFPPEHPVGLPFADSDVTDESFAERSLQEEPEVSEGDIDERDALDAVIGAVVDLENLPSSDTEP